MRHCTQCDLDFSGDIDRCPLCRTELVGTPSPAVFPHTENVRPQRVLLTLVTLTSAVAEVCLVFLGLLGVLPANVCVLAVLLVAANHLFLRNFLRSDPGFVRGASRYLILLVACALVWYAFTGQAAIVSVAVPVICLCAVAFDAVLLIVGRSRFAAEFATYLLSDVICGFVPALLVALGVCREPLLSLVSAFCSAILAVFVLVFFRRELAGAGRRLFNA